MTTVAVSASTTASEILERAKRELQERHAELEGELQALEPLQAELTEIERALEQLGEPVPGKSSVDEVITAIDNLQEAIAADVEESGKSRAATEAKIVKAGSTPRKRTGRKVSVDDIGKHPDDEDATAAPKVSAEEKRERVMRVFRRGGVNVSLTTAQVADRANLSLRGLHMVLGGLVTQGQLVEPETGKWKLPGLR